MSRTREAVRRWRWPAALVLGILTAGVVIALLQHPKPGYLDPGDTGPDGGHALADLLAGRGQQVIRASAPASGGPASGGGLELVTSPGLLSAAQLTQLARFPGDLLLVDPDAAALRAIAPAVRLRGLGADIPVKPHCAAQPAAVAGDATLGGAVLRTSDPAAQACYPNGGGYSLIRYTDRSRVISVLGSGAPLTNEFLSERGDAALAMNLLRYARRVVWLTPSAAPQAAAPPATTGQRPFFSLVPRPVYLIATQLGVAALLAAAWRARRLGPLVAERLPVIVRAAETVEGHGRLYQARRARDRAAGQLREAARGRVARLLSAPGGTRLTATVAARTGRQQDAVTSLLYGPPPESDAALVTLASDLDTLEREVRQS
jgi:hypothetical protein